MRLKTQTVIIKTTNDCNLNCKYCFVEKSVPRNQLISIGIVKRLFDELEMHSSVPKIRLIWHGGEPLLAGITFFHDVLALQKEYKKEFTNCIQTNGTLLTEDFAKFFKDNSFQLGLSLDGPKSLNDSARVDRSNNGTFDRVIKKMSILKTLKIPFGVLATISKYNVGKAEELYNFCKGHSLPLKLSPLYMSGNTRENIDLLSISPDEYAEFLIELTEIWMNDPSPVEIETLESILGNVLAHGEYPTSCSFNPNCYEHFLAIGPTGDLYPCCLFQGFEEYKYGNISHLSIAEIPHSTVWKRLKGRTDYINVVCADCPIMEYCHGGCPFSAVAPYNTLNKKDYYCGAYRRSIPAILEITEKKIRRLENERRKEEGDWRTHSGTSQELQRDGL